MVRSYRKYQTHPTRSHSDFLGDKLLRLNHARDSVAGHCRSKLSVIKHLMGETLRPSSTPSQRMKRYISKRYRVAARCGTVVRIMGSITEAKHNRPKRQIVTIPPACKTGW